MTSAKKKVLKYALNIILILGITTLTLYLIFKDNEPSAILKQIGEADGRWLGLAVILMVIFVCSESVQLRMLFKGMKQKISMVKCILLSNIGFFYSQITPGASGGQPVQILYMTKLGVNAFVSTLVCMMVTIVYKFILVFLFFLALILRTELVGGAIRDVIIFFVIGIICQLGFAAFLLICVLKPAFASWIVGICIKLGTKLHIIKKPDELKAKADHSIQQYEAASDFLKKNKHVMIKMAGITFVQRIAYFAVTFCVAMALRVENCDFISVVSLQIVLSLAVDVLPIPGASGVNEYVFVRLQTLIFGSSLVSAGLLLNRGITYYLLAVVTGIFTLIAHFYFGSEAKKLKNGNASQQDQDTVDMDKQEIQQNI
ncbi:MAG: flippase-like domain-containing protein [Lachnospiraceae bacterium]|nr:flippase-like domain-containing protein [Lachnospiraceae bacterium]